jgi:hypothetical protein
MAVAKPKVKTSNIKKLQRVRIVAADHHLTAGEQRLIEKLTPDEVKALISSKRKLGAAFIRKHAKPSMDYAF